MRSRFVFPVSSAGAVVEEDPAEGNAADAASGVGEALSAAVEPAVSKTFEVPCFLLVASRVDLSVARETRRRRDWRGLLLREREDWASSCFVISLV